MKIQAMGLFGVSVRDPRNVVGVSTLDNGPYLWHQNKRLTVV